ncbi:MAG: HAD-IB family phosphatase [Hyphomicrobiaceae bacterium]
MTRVKCRVLVDFDGTIAAVDTTDLLLETFAAPGWEAIEDEWRRGQIGSRECMLRQIDLVRATPDEMDAFIAGLEIDPDFPGFVAMCAAEGVEIAVVSDGLDRTVGAVLARYGLDLAYHANRLEWLGADRWRLGFPHARGDCQTLAGNCKCQFAAEATGAVRVVVGDGRSDFCVAGEVELVLAKGALAAHCRSSGLAHHEIQSFAEATPLLRAWLDDTQAHVRMQSDVFRDD